VPASGTAERSEVTPTLQTKFWDPTAWKKDIEFIP